MNKKTSIAGFVLFLFMLISTSCSKDEYEPVQTSSQSLGILIECVATDDKSMLADKKFDDEISVEDNNSYTKLKFEIREYGGKCYLSFNIDQCVLKFIVNRPLTVSEGFLII